MASAGVEGDDSTEALQSLTALAKLAGLEGPELELIASLDEFLKKGVGNQVGFHVYDQEIPIDLNLPALLARFAEGEDNSMAAIAALVGVGGAALTTPMYLSIPLEDSAVVDRFLDKLDKVLLPLAGQVKSQKFWDLDLDLFQCLMAGETKVRSCSLRFGPVRYRLYWGRIGNGLYIANSPVVFQDLFLSGMDLKMSKYNIPSGTGRFEDRPERDLGPKAHVMVKLRANHWDRALPGFQMGWAENNRLGCLHNLGPLSSTARALSATSGNLSWDDRQCQVHECAGKLYGTAFHCPDGGRYELTPDGLAMTCSVHGSAREPRQSLAPSATGTVGRLMGSLADVTAAVTFAPEGLRMTLTIEQK